MRQGAVLCRRQGAVMCMRPTSSLDTQSSLCSWMSELAVLRALWRLHTVGVEERLETQRLEERLETQLAPSNSRLQTLRLPSKTCRLHTQSSLLTNAQEVQASGKRCVHASMEKEALVWGTRIVAKARIVLKTVAKARVVEKEQLVY